MDRLKPAQDDLKTAQDALTVLTDELPQFHALLTENEADAQRLKTERAALDDQAQARGRVGVAREMLEQHQSDIQNARAEVERLEALAAREQTLQEMAEYAKVAKEAKTAFDRRLAEVNRALSAGVEKVLNEHDALLAARQAFNAVCTDAELVRELEGRGITLVAGPNPLSPYPFPEPYGGMVWGMVFRLIEQRVHEARNVEEQKRRAEREARREAARVKVRELQIDPRDAEHAAAALGGLVRATIHRNNSFVGDRDIVVLQVLAHDLEQAEALLKGKLMYGGYTVTEAYA